MQTKKLQKYIQKYEICFVVFWWAVVMLLAWLTVYTFHAQDKMTIVLAAGYGILFLLVCITWAHAHRFSRILIKKIKEETGDIETENFISCGPHICVSEHCFVSQCGERIVVLLKENIQAMYFDGRNIIVDVKNRDGIFKFPCNLEENNALQRWLNEI